MTRHFDQDEKSYVILDAEGGIVHFSESVFRTIPKNERCTQASTAIRYLIRTWERESGLSFADLTGKTSVTSNGYQITAEEISVINADRENSAFRILTVTPAYHRETEFDYECSRRFNLTEREIQVAELIVKGMPNKLIADCLHLSLSTVKIHNSNIFRKLQVHSRMGVVSKLTKKGEEVHEDQH